MVRKKCHDWSVSLWRQRKQTRCYLCLIALFLAVLLLNVVFCSLLLYSKVKTAQARGPHLADLGFVKDQQPICNVDYVIPKVALLFIVKTSFPLEKVWLAWFRASECLVPAAELSRYCRCKPKEAYDAAVTDLMSTCKNTSSNVLQRNLLFNAYVHSALNFKPSTGFPGSLVDGLEIENRVATEWGQHSLVVAMMVLLQAALQDEQNQRFVFLSESDVPLYPPALLYLQLIHETRSRVHTCPLDSSVQRTNPGRFYKHDFASVRWDHRMAAGNFTRTHWRKSFQWVSLIRTHAQRLVSDKEVEKAFSRYCIFGWSLGLRREMECVSDEHYIASFLASQGLVNETNSHALTFAHWRRGFGHPIAFAAKQVSPELFEQMRDFWKGCEPDKPLLHALRHVVSLETLNLTEASHMMVYDPAEMSRCPLIGRKFPGESVEAAEQVLTGCYSSSAQEVENGASRCRSQPHPRVLSMNLIEQADWWLVNPLRKECTN